VSNAGLDRDGGWGGPSRIGLVRVEDDWLFNPLQEQTHILDDRGMVQNLGDDLV
jgi:hypothetical protein